MTPDSVEFPADAVATSFSPVTIGDILKTDNENGIIMKSSRFLYFYLMGEIQSAQF